MPYGNSFLSKLIVFHYSDLKFNFFLSILSTFLIWQKNYKGDEVEGVLKISLRTGTCPWLFEIGALLPV